MGITIAETTFLLREPSGKTRRVHIRLGCPYKISEEEAACPVALDGLYEEPCDIRGANTFQALALALGFVRRTIIDWTEKGYTFQYECGDEVPVTAYFWSE
jgi:hypothetical protein